jgi:murein DD-endopeptidase MepM/ murein hydrolase activator NlpD
VVAIFLLLVAGRPALADSTPALHRLQARRDTIAEQARVAEQRARLDARAAYRLACRRQAGFLTLPERRLADTRAFDLALVAARRSAGEARALRSELARVDDERRTLEAAAGRHGASQGGDEDGPRLARPVKGAVVGVPGTRPDPVTGAEVRQQALQILARMNEPVRAPAAGTVRRVEPLPQGGFAVVTEHAGGWISLLAGLREVHAAPGETVEASDPLGLAGRNLDGAVVVSFELWHGRTPVDPRPFLRRHRSSAVR